MSNTNSLESQSPQIGADILLVTVTKVEILAVFDLVKKNYNRECEREPFYIDNNTYYDLGLIGGVKIVMVRSEMGDREASRTISEAIDIVEPSAVIMTGIAFGIDSNKQCIGDVLVATHIQGYELQRIGTDSENKMTITSRDNSLPVFPKLLNRFRDGELSWQNSTVEFGPILSGQKLVDNIDFRNQLHQLDKEAIGGEMEGIGLSSVAHIRKVDWILVKAICDWADGNKHEDKDKRQRQAAENAADFVMHVINKGGFSKISHKNPIFQDIFTPDTVFLAEVTDGDLQKHRAKVKRYLEQRGARILSGKTSLTFLNECCLFIQLISDKIDPDALFQYEQAKTANLPILQWRDLALDLSKITDVAQHTLLQADTVIADKLADFQKYVVEYYLQSKNKNIGDIAKKEKKEKWVFVHTAPEDMALAHQIEDILNAENIYYSLPMDISDNSLPAEIREDIEHNLLACDAVIIPYYNTSLAKVRQYIRSCVQMRAKREQPFKMIAVTDKPFPNKPMLNMKLPNVQILECPTLNAITCLPQFIRSFKT
jgi:nucleoside phosphorylase